MAQSKSATITARIQAHALYRGACILEKRNNPNSHTRAAEWLQKSLVLGNEKAGLQLVVSYLRGVYPNTFNPDHAIELVSHLSEYGKKTTQRLGLPTGCNSPSMRLLAKASEHGIASARFLLGDTLFRRGSNEEERKAGLRHLEIDAFDGNPESQYYLASHYYTDDDDDPKLQNKARYWAKKAALAGYKDAQILMGFMCEDGTTVKRDAREAFFWMHEAAKRGDAKAQAYVGEYLQEGRGIRRNKKKAVRFYRKAAKTQDNGFATVRLGLCYIFGRGIKEDKAEGTALLMKAARNGYEQASTYLALLGQEHIIPLSEARVERYRKIVEAKEQKVALPEEFLPFYMGRKHWVETEYEKTINLRDIYDEYVNADDDYEPLPTPFDPLLNFGKRILGLFSNSGRKG